MSTRKIPLAKPLLGNEEALEVERVIHSGWITQGPEVEAFERDFAGFVGTRHACAVSNCTAALHLALLAVGVKPGDEVITVSHSFIATANSIRYCGATPVFIDIDDTFNLDPALLEAAITEHTRAILCVHQLGMPCDLKSILDIARLHAIPVIEDAACAIGSEILWDGTWERLGSPQGEIACFSFHPRKILTTGDGGMLTTSNPELDRKFRLWRQHGMGVSDIRRHQSQSIIFESYPELGFNYRLTDIQAAIGRVQLRRLPDLLQERQTIASRYKRLLEPLPWITPPIEPSWARSNWQSYAISLPKSVDQRSVMQSLADNGVSTRRGVMCAHREAAYPIGSWRCSPDSMAENTNRNSCTSLSRSEEAQDHAIVLPLFPGMSEEDQRYVIEMLASAVERHIEFRQT